MAGHGSGRLGFAFDRFLPYVTGGLAVGDIHATTPGFAGLTQTTSAGRSGLALSSHSSALVSESEYLHIDRGSVNCGLSCGLATPDNISFSADLVRGASLSVLSEAQNRRQRDL